MTPEETLNPRQKQVLTALVDHYIVRAEPVSSSVLSQNPVLRASSATIRNTLANLEERGFVEQPHASAGRLPTDRGYRTYVDELMRPEPLDDGDRRAIDVAIPSPARSEHPGTPKVAPIPASSEARMAGAARALAEQTRLLGIVVPPSENRPVFRKASIVQIEEHKAALVYADSAGSETAVRSLLVDTHDISIFRLEAVLKRLNAEMQGRPVSLLNNYLREFEAIPVPTDESDALNLLGRSILKLSQEKTGEEVFLSGARNLVDHGDFGKTGEIESILALLDSKVTLVHFLRQREIDDGVHVTIGEERGQDGLLFRSLSLVTASFSLQEGGARGMVGVIGPKRIPYARLVPVVNYAARRLSPPRA